MSCGWGKFEKKEGDLTCSPSRIILFREDIELYKHRYIDKEDSDTKSMELGTVIHKMVLEPEKFHEDYLVLPEKTLTNDLDGKALEALCKAHGLKVSGTKAEKLARLREVTEIEKQYDELLLEIPPGKISLPPSVIKKATDIKDKIYGHPKVGEWVRLSEKEKRGWYTDNGLIMRFQIDGFFNYKKIGVIWDLKTTKDWSKKWFERNLFENGTHLQIAAYRRALKQIENIEIDAFMVIAVNPAPPHQVRYYQIDLPTIQAGEIELDIYLKEYKERLIANDFSPRTEDKEIQTISLRSWDWEKIASMETA
jgi:hypothetical protein